MPAPQNGCIQVLPGSHRRGLQSWGRIARRQNEALTDRDDVDISARTDVPLAAGDAVFFHSLTVHGSGPNPSPFPRHTALYAYFPTVGAVRARRRGVLRRRTFPVVCGSGRQRHADTDRGREGVVEVTAGREPLYSTRRFTMTPNLEAGDRSWKRICTSDPGT